MARNEISEHMRIFTRLSRHRLYGHYRIPDFSHMTPQNKWVDIGSHMSLLQALLTRAKADELDRAVLVREVAGGTGYLGEVMVENRLMAPVRLIPGWESVPPSVWLAFIHALLTLHDTGESICYTANIREDMVSAGTSARKTPASYFHNRVYRELSELGNSLFWQSIEISKKDVHHIHGAVWIDSGIDKKRLRAALRNACGVMPNGLVQSQAVLKSHEEGNEINWPCYSRKQWLLSRPHYGHRPYSYSQELVSMAQILYEATRKFLNARRRILS